MIREAVRQVRLRIDCGGRASREEQRKQRV
jgi:L-alanine-DL-glutamate epimerase-like enolase superfamily enzyme